MKHLIMSLAIMLFIPLAYANSGQVVGPPIGVGAQDFDDDNDGGSSTPALTDYAVLQIDTSAASYDGDADNDTNSYDTECVEGYFLPLVFDISTSKGKAMYSTANSAVLSGYDLVVSYTENTAGICVIDDLFIMAP